MATQVRFNVDEDIAGHETISELLRAVLRSDPLIVAPSKDFVIVSGDGWHFTFTKEGDGYMLTKSAHKS